MTVFLYNVALKLTKELWTQIGRQKYIEYIQKVSMSAKKKRYGACPGVEPGTSRTLSENHATRPTGLTYHQSGKFCNINKQIPLNK